MQFLREKVIETGPKKKLIKSMGDEAIARTQERKNEYNVAPYCIMCVYVEVWGIVWTMRVVAG